MSVASSIIGGSFAAIASGSDSNDASAAAGAAGLGTAGVDSGVSPIIIESRSRSSSSSAKSSRAGGGGAAGVGARIGGGALTGGVHFACGEVSVTVEASGAAAEGAPLNVTLLSDAMTSTISSFRGSASSTR
jgi:hypothetical protein